MEENQNKSEIILYQTEDGQTKIEVRLENETVWLTLNQLSELFQKAKSTISEHINNIFLEGELPREATVRNFRTVQIEKSRSVGRSLEYYNLDVIISVGYRVKSIQGTKFRIWATQRLKEFIVKGFTLDDERLKAGGYLNKYFDELLERIRDIRSSEKNFYYKVKEIYSLSADYDPQTEMTHKFFATVQNKFHWAIHHHTAAELIAQRADATKPFMGLTTWSSSKIRKHDVTVAKNYLSLDELKQLNLLVEQFLAFAESQTQQRKVMYMKDWIKKLNDILIINEREILESPGKISKQKAEEIASTEFEKYKQIEADADIKQLKELEKEVKSLSASPKNKKKK
ncbi:MAG: virulence RhuM family protein [Ignavibacteriales bacterium]|nr:virulence RhuM family protein [Ignavibacteriales bacterium]